MDAVNRRISGDPNKDWVTYVIGKYLSKGKGSYIGLSLGCGVGILERQLQKYKIFKRLEAFDFADEAIRQARKSAKSENLRIHYQVADLNKLKLKQNAYNFIFANSVLHHLENLEFVIEQIDRALIDKGILFISEYVGPSQFQYTNEQVKIINEILNILPYEYRKRVTDSQALKPPFSAPTKEFMDTFDPSEAIRSAEIVRLIKKKFEVVEHTDFGGTLLHMLLQDIAGNFDPKDPKDVTVVNLLVYFENYLIQSKILSSDFTFMVVKKKEHKKFKLIDKFFFNFKK